MSTCARALIVILNLIMLAAPCHFAACDDSQVAANEKNKPLITVSKATTHITEPTTDDGQVDYFAALDLHARSGVTLENNAGVLIARALGPQIAAQEMRSQFFEKLGIAVPPEEGEYFVPLLQFLEVTAYAGDVDEFSERTYQFTRRPWTSADQPILHQWITKNEQPLDLACKASRREKLYLPATLPNPRNDAAPKLLTMSGFGYHEVDHHDLRELSRALAVRAMLRLGEGHTQAAREDLLSLHRLAALTAQSPIMIMRILAFSSDGMASTGEYALAQHGSWTAAALLQARADLEQAPLVADIATAIDIGERFLYLDCVQTIAHGDVAELRGLGRKNAGLTKFLENIPSGAVINFDIAMRMGNDVYDRAADAMRQPDPHERARLLNSLEDELQEAMQKDARATNRVLMLLGGRDTMGKMMGNVFLAMFMPAFNSLNRIEVRNATQRDLARLAFALAAYKADHQKYPQTLDELRTQYIAEIPQDPFNRQPLKYSVEDGKYLLYSVGDNGRDDQARDLDSEPRGDDLVVRSRR